MMRSNLPQSESLFMEEQSPSPWWSCPHQGAHSRARFAMWCHRAGRQRLRAPRLRVLSGLWPRRKAQPRVMGTKEEWAQLLQISWLFHGGLPKQIAPLNSRPEHAIPCVSVAGTCTSPPLAEALHPAHNIVFSTRSPQLTGQTRRPI